jgi:hypothetical protein
MRAKMRQKVHETIHVSGSGHIEYDHSGIEVFSKAKGSQKKGDRFGRPDRVAMMYWSDFFEMCEQEAHKYMNKSCEQRCVRSIGKRKAA